MSKEMKALLTVGLVLFWVNSSLATVAPPVKIRLLGEPHGVQAGESFRGTLEISTEMDADFSGFQLEGPGWLPVSLNAPSSKHLNKNGQLEIPFEVRAQTGFENLTFSFNVDGFTLQKTLNLSREHAARMVNGGQTRQLPNGIRSYGNPALKTLAAGKPDRFDKSDGGSDPEDLEVVTNRTISINGRFVYERNQVTIGADGVTVHVYDLDAAFDDYLGSVTTDPQGFFNININTDDAGETNPDLYFEFETDNDVVQVQDATWEIDYSWILGTWDNFSGSTLNLGTRAPSDGTEQPAVHICTNISRTWRWLDVHEGYETPSVDVQWPEGPTGAYYLLNEIHIGVNRQWDEATHTHEFGHHWVHVFADSEFPDYCNNICDNDPPDICGHCLWCRETDHDAFSEGFPNWLADVITRSYEEDYGIAPLNFRDMEQLKTCQESDNFHDPYLTEGFFSALLRDIEDANTNNDNHPIYTEYSDLLSLGTSEIFDVIDFLEPVTPIEFLLDFRNSYPNIAEDLWETSMHCGLDFDFSGPGPVTNLSSSSHSLDGDSADPTIRYTWNRPSDDASGVAGYGISITLAPSLPSADQDLGNGTSYTTDTLDPGSYFFNIRPVDRAGNWSVGYDTYGPITIRDAGPSDLARFTPSTWDYPLVLRNDTNATETMATMSDFLDGSGTNTFWNVRGINQGESSTMVGYDVTYSVDDAERGVASFQSLPAGSSLVAVNRGSNPVIGGRHSAHVRYDATDQVAEIDETNNLYGHQFIWTPHMLANDNVVSRPSPPPIQAGWYAIDDQDLWYNCAGLRTGAVGWWNAVYAWAGLIGDDYDIRLHPMSTGSEDGFAANIAYSARPSGFLDAVLINTNVVPELQWDVGVIKNTASSSNYNAAHTISRSYVFGDSLSINMEYRELLQLWEFHVNSDNTGPVSITVDVDPADPPLNILWLEETFESGSLSSYSEAAVTSIYTGRARLDLDIPNPGFNCLVVYRDPEHGSSSRQYTLEIQQTPPDFSPLIATGWHSPLVPRAADDGTPTSVPLPNTLLGSPALTYFNFAIENDSPTSSQSGVLVTGLIDDADLFQFSWPFFVANGRARINLHDGLQVSGGRHTLAMICDPNDELEEISEANNVYGEQYVWSPLVMPIGSHADRPSPPDRTAGWEYTGTSGENPWFNCDGLRIEDQEEYWHAMAVMPHAGSDVDVRLHEWGFGTKEGFKSSLVTSSWDLESSDFVLINYNVAVQNGMDVGVIKAEGDSGYLAEHVGSTFYGNNPSGPSTVELLIEEGSILHLHEIFLDPADLSGGSLSVTLEEIFGGVDWGISLYPHNAEFQTKSSAIHNGASWLAGPGQDESFSVTIEEAGYYCLAVWKVKSDDLGREGEYRLIFGNGLSSVEETLPAVTGISSVYPNPFNPQTTIAFDLAKSAHTELAIFDLQGKLVRTLISEIRSPGRHEVIWNGTDNNGQRTASGMYMTRLDAGGVRQMRKLVLVK